MISWSYYVLLGNRCCVENFNVIEVKLKLKKVKICVIKNYQRTENKASILIVNMY